MSAFENTKQSRVVSDVIPRRGMLFEEEQQQDLAELLSSYGSDKDRNGYAHVYSVLFDGIKDRKMNVLEIGIGTMIEGAPSSMKGYVEDLSLIHI